jgi:hypothetical protein
MCSQFSEVFQLCQYVLDNSQNPPLVGVTLETLLRFLNWIPLGYIFETKLISTPISLCLSLLVSGMHFEIYSELVQKLDLSILAYWPNHQLQILERCGL